PERLRQVNQDVEELGAKVLHQWATLGEFDFVNVVEAPDTATIAKVSLGLAARGSVRIETLPALGIEEFLATLEERRRAKRTGCPRGARPLELADAPPPGRRLRAPPRGPLRRGPARVGGPGARDAARPAARRGDDGGDRAARRGADPPARVR